MLYVYIRQDDCSASISKLLFWILKIFIIKLDPRTYFLETNVAKILYSKCIIHKTLNGFNDVPWIIRVSFNNTQKGPI